jgi:CheY-like chemotaxis protein/HPt (histidine-containing phosphotransfer) domain-containing protein
MNRRNATALCLPQCLFVTLAFMSAAVLVCLLLRHNHLEAIPLSLEPGIERMAASLQTELRDPGPALEAAAARAAAMLDAGESRAEAIASAREAAEIIRAGYGGVSPVRGIDGLIQGEFFRGLDADEASRPSDFTGSEWFKEALADGRGEPSPPYVDPETGIVLISSVRKITGASGVIHGYLCAHLSLSPIRNLADGLKAGRESRALILDGEERILAGAGEPGTLSPLSSLGGTFPELERTLKEGGSLPLTEAVLGDGEKVRLCLRELKNGWRAGFILPEDASSTYLLPGVLIIALGLLCAFAASLMFVRLARRKADGDRALEGLSKESFFGIALSAEDVRDLSALLAGSPGLVPGDKVRALSLRRAAERLLSAWKVFYGSLEGRRPVFKPVPGSYALSSLLRDVLETFALNPKADRSALAVFVDRRLPARFQGDATLARRLFVQLLAFVLKNSPSGRVSLSLTGRWKKDGAEVFLEVGVGESDLDPENREWGFVPKKRVEDDEGGKNDRGERDGGGESGPREKDLFSPASGGKATDTAALESLAALLGGELRVFRGNGKGLFLRATFPQAAEGDSPFAAVLDPETKKVLLLEDDRDLSRSLKRSFENLETDLTVAQSEDEFLRLTEEESFTHVLIRDALSSGTLEILEGLEDAPPAAVYGTIKRERFRSFLPLPLYSLPLALFLNGSVVNDTDETRERPLFSGFRVLTAERRAAELRRHAALLKTMGVQTDCASSAAEALALLSRWRYDLVLLDSLMPGMDGVEAVKIIRGMEGGRFSGLPVIALADPSEEGLGAFPSRGFNGFLTRPLSGKALAHVLRRWLPPSGGFRREPSGSSRGEPALGEADAGAPPPLRSRNGPRAGTAGEDPLPPRPGARALVVDDLPTNLEVAGATLAELGCRVDSAASGPEALEMIKSRPYDIVFLDHMMPEMDGMECLGIIRSMEDGRFKELPVVALTANTVRGAREKFLAGGFNEYIPKPVEPELLEGALRRLLPDDSAIAPESGVPFTESPEEGGRVPESLKNPSADPEKLKEAFGKASFVSASPPEDALGGTPQDPANVNFQEGARATRSRKGYRRVLKVFLHEAPRWREELSAAESPRPFRASAWEALFSDMESSAAIIGASGLGALVSRVRKMAESEAPSLKEELSRLKETLSGVEARAKEYLALEEATAPARESAAETGVTPGETEGSGEREGEAADVPKGVKAKARGWAEKEGEKEDGERAPARGESVGTPESASAGVPRGAAEDGEDDPRGDPTERLSEIDFQAGLERCRGKRDRYAKLLNVYREDLTGWIKLLTELPEKAEPDLKELVIIFHSMKSASASVGAEALSREAKLLEGAGRGGDLPYIAANREKCLRVLESQLERLNRYLES